MKKKSIFIIVAGILAAGCNNGALSQASNTKDQENNFQPKSLASLTTNSNQIIGGSGTPLGFKELQVGMGYDPSSDKVYPGGAPKLSKFAYTATDGSIEKALLGCNTYEFHSRASEFADLKSTSSKSLFSGEVGLGVNYGLAKLAVAAKYGQQDSALDGSASINRQIGANTSCKIYTLIDGQTGVEYADRVGQAMLNGNEIMRQILSEIRSSNNYDERATLIKKFYEHFGTHMISGLTLGEMAITSLSMTQKISETEAQKSGSAAVEFSVPFVSAKAGAEFATASKFDAKNWNVQIYEDFIPGDTKLKDEILRLKKELDEAKQSGVIDFTKLKPEPVEIKDPVHQPDLSKYKIDADELKTAANVRKAVNLAAQKVTAIKNLTNKISTNKGKMATNKVYYSAMVDPLKILNENNLVIISDSDYLTSADRKKYETGIAPYANEWAALPELVAKVVNETDQANFDTLEKEIFGIFALANNSQHDAQTQTDSEESGIQANNKFRTDYPTVAAYLEKKYYTDTRSTYCPAGDNCSYEMWYKTILSNHSEKLKEWTTEYENQFNSKQLLAGNKLVTHKNRPPLLAGKKNHSSRLSVTLSDSDITAEEAIYKDRIITDFNLVAWSNIFPELLNKYTVKDLSEQAENALKESIKPYYLAFGYLQFAKHYDPILATLYANEVVVYKAELDNIKRAIDSAGTSHMVNVLNKEGKLEKSYNMDNVDDMASLSKRIDGLITKSPMFSSQWGLAVQALMTNGIISRFGSLAGINPTFPQPLPGFGWMIDSTKIESLPTPEVLKTTKEKSPLALALELVSNYYHKTFGTENKLNRLFLYNSGTLPYYEDSSFKNKMVSNGLPVPMSLLENIPENNRVTRLLGVMPLVTSFTRIEGSKIVRLSIIDSSGHIWSMGDNDNYNRITQNSDTYSIDLSKNINPSFSPEDEKLFPAFQLTPDNGGKIQEVRWGFYNGNSPLHAVNKIFLSGLPARIFAPDNDSSSPQDDVVYQSTYSSGLQSLAIFNKYSHYLPSSGSDVILTDSYFTSNSNVFSDPKNRYGYPYPSLSSYVADIFSTTTLLIGAGYGLGLGSSYWDHNKQCGNDKSCKNNLNGSLVSYNLVITPVNNNVMNVLVDELPKTPQKQPLFPIYPFSN